MIVAAGAGDRKAENRLTEIVDVSSIVICIYRSGLTLKRRDRAR
jgi:hypothetical protein